MRFRLAKKILTTRSHYTISDPAETPLFEVIGKRLALGNKLTITTVEEPPKELGRIEQQLWALRSTYHLHRDGQPSVRIRRMLWPFFKARYEVEPPGAEPIACLGNLWEREFTFQRGDRQLGYVSKKLFSWADSYGIDVDDDEDQLLFVAATVVIDLVTSEMANSG